MIHQLRKKLQAHTFRFDFSLRQISESLSYCYGHLLHGDVIKWKISPRYWPFVRGIHRSPVRASDAEF